MEITRQSFSLRPLKETELGLVLNWRNDSRVREVSQSNHLILEDEHLRWFRRMHLSPNAQLLMFEFEGRPTGCVNFTDMSDGQARWGFYLDPDQTRKGLGLKMGFLALDLAFSKMGLKVIKAEVLSSNLRGFEYHKRLGFRLERTESQVVNRGDYLIDLHHLLHQLEVWNSLKMALSTELFGH